MPREVAVVNSRNPPWTVCHRDWLRADCLLWFLGSSVQADERLLDVMRFGSAVRFVLSRGVVSGDAGFFGQIVPF
jgi:hypothetical protein